MTLEMFALLIRRRGSRGGSGAGSSSGSMAVHRRLYTIFLTRLLLLLLCVPGTCRFWSPWGLGSGFFLIVLLRDKLDVCLVGLVFSLFLLGGLLLFLLWLFGLQGHRVRVGSAIAGDLNLVGHVDGDVVVGRPRRGSRGRHPARGAEQDCPSRTS